MHTKRDKCNKIYRTWGKMMRRCLAGGDYQKEKPAYIGCHTSVEFSNFESFSDWAITQQGCLDQGYNLDKDLLVKGNKLYSEETCVYIPALLNSLFISHPKTTVGNVLPVGVYKRGSTFRACISVNGRTLHSSTYNTPEPAREWYVNEKLRLVGNWIKYINDGKVLVDNRVLLALLNFEVV